MVLLGPLAHPLLRKQAMELLREQARGHTEDHRYSEPHVALAAIRASSPPTQQTAPLEHLSRRSHSPGGVGDRPQEAPARRKVPAPGSPSARAEEERARREARMGQRWGEIGGGGAAMPLPLAAVTER